MDNTDITISYSNISYSEYFFEDIYEVYGVESSYLVSSALESKSLLYISKAQLTIQYSIFNGSNIENITAL